jgi:hypothetical protein
MKLLGDADLNRARIYALRKSSDLRRELKDPNGDKRLAYIRSIDELSVEEIINLITIFSSRQITQNAIKEIRVKVPKPPKSNASLEVMEKYQKEVDDYPVKRQEATRLAVEKEVSKLNTELHKKSKEELYAQYIMTLIDEFCEKEAFDAFKVMQVYLGCYKDDNYKEKYFSSFDEFDNLETTMK